MAESRERAAERVQNKSPDKEPGRLVVTLQAPTWLWLLALALAVAVNVVWWVIASR